MKTKFDSYCINDIADGCKYCLPGEKVVLFMGGKCSRNCWYCSLSDSRKKCKTVFANERLIKRTKDLIKEITESNAKGMGITGGDPLQYYRKILKFSKKAKKKFEPGFHIHIYLPLNLVTLKKIKKLSKYVDEFRFHPSLLINENKNQKEIFLLKQISDEVGKDRVGIELPLIPDKEKEIINFILQIKNYIGFLNLNEFEISETNFNVVTKKYRINSDSYTISNSKKIGLKILQALKNSGLKIHLCTARTKDGHQYVNRLKKHNILPFGNKTSDGNVIYFATYPKNLRKAERLVKKSSMNYYVDKNKKRIIIKMQDVEKVYYGTGLKIARVLEPPTFDSDYLEFSWIDE
ncbi:MAG: radical SAM protein [Nanoarchaeota archaeon]|nr:radical SAM protein [Nanoarchaeota archaeon]